LGVRGLNLNLRTIFCRVPHGELTAKKWLNSTEKQKRRSNLKERDKQTSGQTSGQTGRVNC